MIGRCGSSPGEVARPPLRFGGASFKKENMESNRVAIPYLADEARNLCKRFFFFVFAFYALFPFLFNDGDDVPGKDSALICWLPGHSLAFFF